MKKVDFVCPKCGRRVKFTYNIDEERIANIVCYCGKSIRHTNDPQGKTVVCCEDHML